MAELILNKGGKYGYLFVQDMSGAPASRGSEEALARYRRLGARQLWIDGNCVPGAFQMNTCFWTVRNKEMLMEHPNGAVVKGHSHPYPEILGFVGTDPDDPLELGGEVEFWVDGEAHLLTRSTMVYLPPDLPHCPLFVLKVSDPKRPIFHFSVVLNDTYGYEQKADGVAVKSVE